MTRKIELLITAIRDKGIVDNTKDPRFTDKVGEMAEKGLHVYHVNEANFIMGGVDKVKMTSYMFVSRDDVSKEGIEDFWWNFNDGYAFANVINHDWGIEEMGSIMFELKDGMMKRVG